MSRPTVPDDPALPALGLLATLGQNSPALDTQRIPCANINPVNDSHQPPGILPAGRRKRWWLLLLAMLVVCAVGVVYLLKWNAGLRGFELLQFFTFYLAVPLASGLLLMFAYLRTPPR